MIKQTREYLRLVDSRGALPALDGLRGIAILLVVFYHAADSFRPDGVDLLGIGGFDLLAPLLSGWMGVNLFFVLSGFLITWHLIRNWRSENVTAGDLKVYLTKRWLRIVPTYYVVLFIAAFELTPNHPIDSQYLGLKIGYHLIFLQDYLPSSILGPFWSLAVEEKFYLLMPIIILVAWRLQSTRIRIGFFLGIALLPVVFRLAMWFSGADAPGSFVRVWRNPFHLNLDALFLGVAVAWLVSHWVARPRSLEFARMAMRLGALVTIAVAVLPEIVSVPPFVDHVIMMPVVALGMSACVLGAAMAPAGTFGALESLWLARAGKLAYPWYLSHILVMWWIWEDLREAFPRLAELTPGAQFFIFMPIYLGASIAAALVLHFLVEKPCLLLKDSIGRTRRVRKPTFTPQAA